MDLCMAGHRWKRVGLLIIIILICGSIVSAYDIQAQESTDLQSAIRDGMAGEAALFWTKDELIAADSALQPRDITSDDTVDTENMGINTEDDTEAGSLVMANVTNTLNVRQEPDEGAEKVGYLYADCGGTILEKREGWTKLESGELIGWANDKYLLFGAEARQEAEAVGRTIATVTGDTLRIRKEPTTDAKIYGLAAKGEIFEVLNQEELEFSGGIEFGDGWAAVDFEGQTGYISADYVEISFEYDYGETLEQIKEREEAERRAENIRKSTIQTEAVRANAGGIPAGTSDVVLLAALVQCEAGGESYEGQLAVASVVANRVRSGAYPNTVSGVIFASGQFSPAGSGKVARLIESGNIKQSCLQAATEALSGVTNIGGATRFRRAGSRQGVIVGNHVFW